MMTRRAALLLAGAVAAAALTACAKNETTTGGVDSAASSVTVADQWVKAAPTGMTGFFGTLKNSGSRDVTVVSATSAAAGKVELHEVVAQPGGGSTMQPKQGGFVIPAGGTHVLAPGADHVMLMDLKKPLQVGSDVEVTLSLDDGSTVPVTAQVRDFPGAGESYAPAATPSGHAGHPGGHG